MQMHVMYAIGLDFTDDAFESICKDRCKRYQRRLDFEEVQSFSLDFINSSYHIVRILFFIPRFVNKPVQIDDSVNRIK